MATNKFKADYANLSTPPACVADFCLIPIGTPTASVSSEIAAVQRLMKASGLDYSMHSAGTTVEGSWEDVMRVIGQAHTLVHENGTLRVQSDIRVGTRTDKKQHFSEKVSKVESILAQDSEPEPERTRKKSSTFGVVQGAFQIIQGDSQSDDR
ncbi:hypothetical protein HYALB_00008719 [Hymenoscyphus albidus]|uniref:Thiamine-binding protein domain-containing protein n=1 Tax=Hymenoscyphus albidus TaxID=595503 RepID=A0A9N9LPL7_9HELO|nr:hypothetical protein HYALB_00008719 [Hymenoscyphus albidus]